VDTSPDRTPQHLDQLFDRMGVAPETIRTALDERMVLTEHARTTLPPPALVAAHPELVLGREIGRGGMGMVVLAEQTSLGREVAVKRLRPDVGGEQAIRTLLQEALVTGALEHPNIVPIYQLELGEAGAPLIVMKRIEGVPWSDCIADPSKLPGLGAGEDVLAAHLRILDQVCNAVAFAHSKRIVHRDLKPANVMIGAFGEVYVLDWGLALCLDPDGAGGRFPTAESQVGIAGTPFYMAPEMTVEDPGAIDERTDVYLLGAVLHQVVTGKPRHPGKNLREVLSSVCHSRPHDYGPEVPPELADIMNRATHQEPARRFPSAEALRNALRDFAGHRASLELTREASERLEPLVALLSGPIAGSPGRAHDLFGECRFGFQQALRLWPDNLEARRGLTRALLAMLELEIRRENLPAAAALLGELQGDAGELGGKVGELASRLRRAQREIAALRELQAEHDLRKGSRSRSYAAMVFAAASLVNLVLYFLDGAGVVHWNQRLYLAHGIGMLALVGMVLLAFWSGLTQNQANRQVLYTLVGAGVIGMLFRSLVVATGQPLRVSFALEYLFWGLGMCVISMFAERRLVIAGLFLFAGATAGALWPVGVLLTSFLATAAAMAWTAYVWWPHAERPPRG
jgi:eukaryotic-like serine/threonine-protein kinase